MWQGEPLFQRLVDFFGSYPVHSLLSSASRALLYNLVLAQRPQAVLEIGTYLAGTTEVLARALWEVGAGHLDTIDPFGAETVPPVIAGWPADLRSRVTFHPVDSGMFFCNAIPAAKSYDLIFIDGNHELEFAYFDLLCAARISRPGGIVVLDNVDQPGPKFASRMFLTANPDWTDFGDAVAQLDISEPLQPPVPAFPETVFYVLRAPSYYSVSAIPRSFGSLASDQPDLALIELELARPARGRVHIQAYSRTFGLPIPEELQAAESFPIDVPNPARSGPVGFDLSRPLHSSLTPEDAGVPLQRRIEVILAFTSDDPDARLALKAPPRHYPARR